MLNMFPSNKNIYRGIDYCNRIKKNTRCPYFQTKIGRHAEFA